MGEFQWLFQLIIMVFFALQLERINQSLKQMNKTLSDVLEKQSASENKPAQ